MPRLPFGDIGPCEVYWVFELHWRSGVHGSVNLKDNIGTLIGFDDSADDTGANTYISDNEVP